MKTVITELLIKYFIKSSKQLENAFAFLDKVIQEGTKKITATAYNVH